MAKAALTTAYIKNLLAVAPGERKYRVYDLAIPGFAIEVCPSGRKTFWLRYTDPRHRRRELRLGRYGDITADQARKKAQEKRAAISLGGDPAGTRDRLAAIPTVAAYAADMFIPHAREHLRSHANYEAAIRLRIAPALGRKALDEVTPAHIAAFRRGLIDEGLSNASVNRHLAVLRRMFSLALRWGLYQGANPAQHPGMLREEPRESYLAEAQVAALMAALGEDPDPLAGRAIALLALTGARRSEVLRARWADVDVERRLLTVPRSKSGRRRHIPLSDAALRLLETLPRAPGQEWLFPSPRRPGRPMQSVRSAWARARRAAALPAGTRLHDLRHTFASILINGGRSLYDVSRVLGHTQLATTARYAHLSPQTLVEAANMVGRVATGAGDALAGPTAGADR
ncbi:Tyrosine-type recombinase/integrase [Rhodovastum atsumiense]|uniref:Tyrosine-type recombinase/integrase n=1 Tax=Rhodovastum atsumiense TaxID=504468 RepID=A0A5M6INK8_9PROT|nr:site-specific integrase [Rhodovastum atsumiense]KAA5609844.1 tyrosine-type recombinase/integrase [Rhodovastum atsumiense]CAH2603761.1 Tyrosine-type recombinase/integrase [Rhodovastum atsumiense]